MQRALRLVLVTALGIVASSCGGGSSSGSQSNSGEEKFTTVAVTPTTASIFPGETAKFQAKVVGQSNQNVTWSLQKGSLGTIDSTGLYTAPANASGGPYLVLATSKAVPNAMGSGVVTVLAPRVTLAPASTTLAPGGTQTFTANVRGLANTQLTWSVQEVSGGSVSASGFYNAPQSTGFYHVVATSVVDANVTASATVTVTTLAGRFTPTGNMPRGHTSHTATLLANGKVLITGGKIQGQDLLCPDGMAAAELYDSTAGSFVQTRSMISARYAHTATALLNGQVLVTGGIASGYDCEDVGNQALNSAELYEPSSGFFTAAGSMDELRAGHTATLLPSGKVLVAGGTDGNGYASKTAELYDPQTGAFSSTGDMSMRRSAHTATLLASGKVLIAGGIDPSGKATAEAEIYDPGTGTFSLTGSMTAASAGHTATLLATGRVLITGGSEGATAELYDPNTRSFARTGDMVQARSSPTATLLPDGNVLIAGGVDSTAEIYNPSTGSFTPTGGMQGGRSGGQTATPLPNGKVLVAGGGGWRHPLATAELYK